MILIHDSFSEAYRCPVGALPTNSSLRLRVCVRDEPPSCRINLLTWSGGEARYPMRRTGEQDGMGCYEVSLPVGPSPCLLWYRFEADTGVEVRAYGAPADRLDDQAIPDREDGYQVTVYDAGFDTPHWVRHGVAYQIMTDRFFRGVGTEALLHSKDFLPGITLHDAWDEVPGYIRGCWQGTGNEDFYGGNLEGIRQKLPYLRDLGITVLYLNPIFEARSCHKYDTADYSRIDPMFGIRDDLCRLCHEARQMGMRVILDGVFSHVGDDSIYFNRLGTYGSRTGAFRNRRSPCYKWFSFSRWPDDYDCWWNLHSLPNVNEMDPDFREYILNGKNAIIHRWQRCGTSGWRLDAIEELPLPFLRELRREVKGLDPDAIVLGEIWQDASRAMHNDELRCYVLGDTLDSVVNYPLRDALIRFLLFRTDVAHSVREMMTLQQNYPQVVFYSLMNVLGTHDLPRILNILAGSEWNNPPDPEEGLRQLSAEERRVGLLREGLMLRYILSLPGMPCVYYGDEAAIAGAQDPFCRSTFPWGQEDVSMQGFYRRLISMRHDHPVLRTGTCRFLSPAEDILAVCRDTRNGLDAFGDPLGDEFSLTCINRSAFAVNMVISSRDVHGVLRLTSDDGEVFTASEDGFCISLGGLQGITLFGAAGKRPE